MNSNEDLLEAFAAIRGALLTNDVGALAALVAEDYLGFDPTGGEHDRQMLLQAYGPGGVDLSTYETDEVTTRIVGDVGLVMGVGALSGSYGEQVFEHTLRFLDVYVFRDSSWRLSVSQVTEMTVAD